MLISVSRNSIGHVFVLHCCVGGLACDATLRRGGKTKKLDEVLLDEKESEKSHVRVYRADYEKIKQVEHELLVISTFLGTAAEFFTGKVSLHRRTKPLIGFNLVDDFEADSSVRGDLVRKSYDFAIKYDVDIAICVSTLSIYQSTTKFRVEMCPIEDGPFWMLNKFQHEQIERLINLSKAGRLNVFMGAGISIPSGAPSWKALLAELAVLAGYSEQDRKYLAELDYLDQPTILEEDMGQDFKKGVAKILKRTSRFTPVHSLIRSLQCPCVTTNYDCLFEQAGESVGEFIYSLPWNMHEIKEEATKQSLLKLHGCVKNSDSIVLSRKDYMRYPDTRQALRGCLHSMFMTSDVLFAGFSMTDDNVHKIIDDVRKVSYVNDLPVEGKKIGTILCMTYNKMLDRLWDQDFDIVSFGKTWDDNPAWHHDCFFDRLAWGHSLAMS